MFIKILQVKINSKIELDSCENQNTKWNKLNSEILTRSFDNDSIANEYIYKNLGDLLRIRPSIKDEINDLKERIQNKIMCLESIIKRLDYIPESKIKLPPAKPEA